MAEYIGGILIPEPTKSGTFPLLWDFSAMEIHEPIVDVHRMGASETLLEQRFYRGTGARKFRLSFSHLSVSDRATLLSFFQSHLGSYHTFTLNWIDRTGATVATTARFSEPILSLDHAHDWAYSTSIELVEVNDAPSPYTVNSTETRFPGVSLTAALLAQTQEIIPLLKLSTDIYLSDRRCTVGGTLYQPRLLSWDGIKQSTSGSVDSATFKLGNADRVFRDLSYSRELRGVTVQFSLYHVGTGIKLDLWQGSINAFSGEADAEFTLSCWDIAADPRHAYPTRLISRQDGFDPGDQPVNVGGKKGISPITATSIINETAYGKPLRDIFVNDAYNPLPVVCDIVAGRDESEFYAALGVIGRGPISGFYSSSDKPHTLDNQPHHGSNHDPWYGLRRAYGGDPTTGDETAKNNSPDDGSNSFALDEVGKALPSNPIDGCAFLQIRRNDEKGIQPARTETHSMVAMITGGLGCWTWTAPSTRSWTPACTNPVWIAVNVWLRSQGLQSATYTEQEALFDCAAAITAAAYCDAKVKVILGSSTGTLTADDDGNGGVTCAWASGDYFERAYVNRYLKISSSYYLVTNYTYNSNPALSTLTTTLDLGNGTYSYELYEPRFTFTGIIGSEQKPVRDWLREILACCLGTYNFASGKLRILIRADSGVDEAFTSGNIIYQSLHPEAIDADYNDYTLAYSDVDYGYQQNSITLKDADDITARGQRTGHRNLLASCGKSQAARICTTEFREVIGGITSEQKRLHRAIRFRTTILALATEPGMVCSVTHDDAPNGSCEFRIHSWSLNPDYSIDIEGFTTCDDMYDLLQGDIPIDVAPDTPPVRPTYDTRPGDVTGFTVTAALIDGIAILITGEYTPPYPIGVFVGVSPVIEIPSGSGKYYPQGDHDYDDSSPTGTFELRVPAPSAVETWKVFCPSRSAILTNPLDALNTPSDEVEVDAATTETRSNSNNLVYDPSFDQGETVWDSGTDGDVEWVEAEDEYHTPYKSRSYTGAPSMAGKYAALSGYNKGYIECTKDKLYTLSCWVRANSSAVGTLSLSIMGLSLVGVWRGVVANVDQDVAALADDTWVEIKCSAYLTDELTKYLYPQITITSGTAGKVWVDDVDLREHEPSVPAVVGSATASFSVDGATDNSILSETGQEMYRLRVASVSLPADQNCVTWRVEFDRSDDSNPDFTDYSGPLSIDVASHVSDPWLKTDASFTIQARIVGVNRDAVETVLWTSSPVTVAPSGARNIPGAKITTNSIDWTSAATAAGMTNTVNQAPNGSGHLVIAKTSETVFNTYNGRLYVWSTSLARYKPKVDAGDFNQGCIDSYLIFANSVVTNNVLAGSITTTKLLAGLLSGFTLYLEQNGVISQFYSTYDSGMGVYTGFKTHRISDGLACKISFGGVWVVGASYPSQPLLWLGVPNSAYPSMGWQLPSAGSLIPLGSLTGAMYLSVIGGPVVYYGISTCKAQQFVDSAGKRLIAGRATGWSTMSGTLSRTAWNTETVTLVEVARTLAALIYDMYGSDAENTYPVKLLNLLGS